MTALVLPRGMGIAERTKVMKRERRTVGLIWLKGKRA
jgi:hypothetical protein